MTKLNDILPLLKQAETILITGHLNPDGDALGAGLALKRLLHRLGKKNVFLAFDGVLPRMYSFLPGYDEIDSPTSLQVNPELIILLDASRVERMGNMRRYIQPDTRLVVIDHHADPTPEGDYMFVDETYAATGEIIAELYHVAGLAFTYPDALALYVAVATDTGGFRFSNTSVRTHQLAAQLLATGIEIGPLSEKLFDIMPVPRFELLRRVVSRMQRADNGMFSWTWITAQDFAETGAEPDDLTNLVNLGRNIEGIKVSVLFREIDEHHTKISLRSTEAFDSAVFAARFGGGGHRQAAGATIRGKLADVREHILDLLEKEISKT